MSTVVSGGTAVEDKRRWPLFAALGGAVLLAVLVMVLLGGGDDKKPVAAQPTAPVQAQDTPSTQLPTEPAFQDTRTTPQQPTGPDLTVVAAGLERDLKRQRLWSSVSVTGSRIDVRSGSCSDPAMVAVLDGAMSGLRAAGLTKLRCLEQSGQVVSDRDL
jgi:hypothetical protein